MEWIMTEPRRLATSPGMTHRNGRLLVAGGPGCGIMDSFESRTGVDTEAARLFRV